MYRLHTCVCTGLSAHTSFNEFAVILPGGPLSLSWQIKQSRTDYSWSQLRRPQQKFIQTLPQHSLSSLSRNFQRFEGQCCRQLLGVSNREARHSTQWSGTIPKLSPSPPAAPLLSVIVLTEVEGWGCGGSRGVKPSLLCLGVLESRSRLDLIFSLLPPSHPPSSSMVAAAKKKKNSLLFNPCCLFHFSPSQPMCRTHPTLPSTPPPPSPRSSPLLTLMSPFSRRTKCQPFIRDKQLSPLLGGRREDRQSGGSRKEKWKKNCAKEKKRREDTDRGRQRLYDVTAAFEF